MFKLLIRTKVFLNGYKSNVLEEYGTPIHFGQNDGYYNKVCGKYATLYPEKSVGAKTEYFQ